MSLLSYFDDDDFVEDSECGNCKECRGEFVNVAGDDAFGTGLCYRCFECALEERRYQRIELANEY